MERSYFFNSLDGDRLYDAESFAEAFGPLFANGVFNGELQVLADSGMNIKVMTGNAWINGRAYRNTEEKTLTLGEAIGGKKRIDSVVIRLDEIERKITAVALKGEESLDPEPPALQRQAGYYDLRIAEILVRPGVLEIVQADITDTRMDDEKCGWVAGAVKEISFEQITKQFDSFLQLYKKAKEDEFSDWFGNTEAAERSAKEAEEYAKQAKQSAEEAKDTAEGNFITESEKGAAGGVATLDSARKVPGDQMGNAPTADTIKGLTRQTRTGSDWGNQAGSSIAEFSDGSGGAMEFMKNNPEAGQFSVKVDGYFYQREGAKRCLDEEDWKPENIGNNGTGGLSVGMGLLNSSEKIYRYILPTSTFTRCGPVSETEYQGTVYYSAPFSTSNTAAYDFLSGNMGADIYDQVDNVPSYIASYADFILVSGNYGIEVLYTSEGMADNGPSEYTLTISENIGTRKPCQTVFGSYNRANTYEPGNAPLLEVGSGTVSSRSNALRLNSTNQMYLGAGGAYKSSGADHAEFVKPWADRNPDNEDRVGYMVTVRDGLLHKAEAGDYIVGIISGNPCVVGNADEDYYWRYKRDKFNRIVMETVPETIQHIDNEGQPIFDEESGKPVTVKTGKWIRQPEIAEGYNPALQDSYVERKDRKEWDYVGMLGVIPVWDDGTCLPGGFCKCGGGGVATQAEERGFDTFFVLERISENVVSVQLKGI